MAFAPAIFLLDDSELVADLRNRALGRLRRRLEVDLTLNKLNRQASHTISHVDAIQNRSE